MQSVFAPPGDDYLNRLGELIYAIASLEGTLLFDLLRLHQVIPTKLTAEALAGGTTVVIGQRLIDAAPKVTDDAVCDDLEIGWRSL